MRKKTLFIVSLLWTIAHGAWAWDGSGTSADPYQIQSSADWKQLADDVSGGESYCGRYFEMTANVDAQGVSVGAEGKPFSGILSGAMYTLTFNRGAIGTYVGGFNAPFVSLSGATIKDITVKGDIASTSKYAAGIACFVEGTASTTFSGCHVATRLFGSHELKEGANFGGFVGEVRAKGSAMVSFKDCSFQGMMGDFTAGSAAFVGYTTAPVKIDHSVVDPITLYTGQSNTATFVRAADGVQTELKECYYTKSYGEVQGQFSFTEVTVPDGCKVEFVGEPVVSVTGKKYYASGAKIQLTVPQGTAFHHWATSGTPVGCFISDPWTAEGTHTLSDVHAQPTLTIATSMPEPVQSSRERCGITYRYISNRDYLLFMSDSLRQARNIQFDSDGEAYFRDDANTKNYITVVWGCDPTSSVFQNYYREGWFWTDKNYEGSIVMNDLASTAWDHTQLFGIAPRAFQNVKELKRILFVSNIEQGVFGKSNCTAPLNVVIQEQAFKGSGIEELVMVYKNERTDKWEELGPTSGVTIAADAFDDTDGRICVAPSVYQQFLSDNSWSDLRSRFAIYAAKVKDTDVEGATYSYWRDSAGEPLKNDDAGNNTMMQSLRYWNADYKQFNAATLLSTSNKNIWYTQVVGADDSYLKSHNGVMRIYNDPGSQYNYKTIAIQSLGQSKEVKAIEFYQTNGLSDNSESELKMVIQNGAFKGCDNLKELRLFYYVEDGEDHWTTLGPKDVIPGDNIFGEPTGEEILETNMDGKELGSRLVPEGFRILVAPELFSEYLADPNWQPYLPYLEPVDFAPTEKKDFTSGGLTYGYISSPGGIMQTSQVVSQDVSWWTVPRIGIEVLMWVSQIKSIYTSIKAARAAAAAAKGALETAEQTLRQESANLTALQTSVGDMTKMINNFANAARAGVKGSNTVEGSLIYVLDDYSISDYLTFVQKFAPKSYNQLVEDQLIVNGVWNATEETMEEMSADYLCRVCGMLRDGIRQGLTEKNAEYLAGEAAKRGAAKAVQDATDRLASAASARMAAIAKGIGQLGAQSAATATAAILSTKCWGGSSSYDVDRMNKGMRENILSNIHQVGVVGGGYVITTPNKNIIYHTYVKDVGNVADVTIHAGFGYDRTTAIARKAFRDHKNLKTVKFHAVEGQTSNAAMPMLLTIPDSAFVGCENLVEFSTLLEDNETGTRALGPENFILAGDSIFAGLDSLKFHIVIDPSRKQDFLNNESWAPLKRFFTYREAKPKAKFDVYGGQYAYSYENNSIKREHKVSGHRIEHTEVIGADNTFLDEHQGALKLCNDIGRFDNFQIDAVRHKAFQGNEHLRVVNFTDLYGAGAWGDSYTGLEMALGDSCFANCKNLANLDMLYLVTDGDNHIDLIKPEQVTAGKGILDGTEAIIKMMPQQVAWFEADSSWVAYKNRFRPCIIKPADEGVKNALKDMPYYDMAHTGNDWTTWDDYIDLARIAGAGFSWLDGRFREEKDDLLSFPEFQYFGSVGLDYVGDSWFRGCVNMSNIILPQTIKTIKDYAFASCFKLEEIELPASVTEIGNQAFDDCRALRTIVVRSTTPAKLTGSNQFLKLDGLKIYVPAASLDAYLTAWAEYKDYIVSDASYKVNKVVKLDKAGTLADELGLYVEWSYSGAYAGDEPRYIHGNYTKYDSLTVSGPLNDLDLWVIRYLAGNNGYDRGGVATGGCLRYLNLYNASIVKDSLCKAHYLNNSMFVNNLWREIDKDNVLPIQSFHGCTALETVILPKTLTTITSGIFEGCKALKRVTMTGALKEYDGYGYKLYHMLDYPLEELVLYTDGHATSDAKNPWGKMIGAVYTTQTHLPDYLNDPNLVNQTENVAAPFEDDVVWDMLVESGEFFPSVFLKKEDVGTIFSEQNKPKALKTFDEFQYFNQVKAMGNTFAFDELLERVSIPASVERISEDAFANCFNLKTITMMGDSVPVLGKDAFRNLPADFVIYVPRDVVKVYRAKWAQYADHINPVATDGGSDKIITVTLTEPNTLAGKLGLTPTWVKGVHMGKSLTCLKGLRGDYSKITRLKVVGPISGGDLALMRHLAGFCSWANTRNFAGHLEYIDLYDAHLKATDYCVAPDVITTRDVHAGEDNVLPAYSLLQAYNLRTLILPRTLKEVRSRALQQCEGMETLVVGDDMEKFDWNALDDDASLTRMYILSKKKMEIGTEFAVWRWLCNNYNPTFDAFYVRPSQYQNYLSDDAYTGSSWQRTNNISKGAFEDDESFAAFASHATATVDELMTVTTVKGWFDNHTGVKDLTALQYTLVDSLDKATLAPLTKMEKVALPITLASMEDGLFENAKHLRAVDFLLCDSTDVVAGLRDGGFARLGINTQQTLCYVPATYGDAKETNIVVNQGGTLRAKTFRICDSLDYVVPYPFEAGTVENPRTLAASSIPYTFCVPYKMNVPAYARAYKLSSRDGNNLVFQEVKGELEAMHPYLLKVVGNKRLRKMSATLNTSIQQTIPATGVATYGRQFDAPGYSIRGTFETIGNAEAAELGAYVLQSDGDWHPVTTAQSQVNIKPFRAFLLPSARNAARIGMSLVDDGSPVAEAIDTIETIDQDGTRRYYDLNGRKVDGSTKGIVIKNGKKVIRK